jgi:hypothetical protein
MSIHSNRKCMVIDSAIHTEPLSQDDLIHFLTRSLAITLEYYIKHICASLQEHCSIRTAIFPQNLVIFILLNISFH